MSVRDSQRSKLYRAEYVIRKDGQKFNSIEEIQAYVDKLLGSAWAKRRGWGGSITVVKGREGTAAYAKAYRNIISLPSWAWCEAVVIHEICHKLTDWEYGHGRIAWHGREFARIYLEVVRHKMGDESWRKLKDAFVEAKVKHTKPRTLTAEQREAMADRLAEVRSRTAA